MALDVNEWRWYCSGMASLKYYDVERETLPQKILQGVVLGKDVDRELRRVCRHFGVPTIKWELWEKDHSCYTPGGYGGAAPSFKFSRRTYVSKGSEVPFIYLHHFLHEIAHYLDDCQRSKEIEFVFRNDTRNYVRRSATIRRAKWHGPRHRAQMLVLVKWWLN